MASSSHLKPGERGTIVARVSTPNRIGKIIKIVQVFTNDPKKQRVILTLKADL